VLRRCGTAPTALPPPEATSPADEPPTLSAGEEIRVEPDQPAETATSPVVAPTRRVPPPRSEPLPPDRAREAEYIERYKAGDQRAGEALLKMHEGLIFKYARRYYGKGVDADDLLQEAKLGFLHGVTKFETGHNCGLTTYGLQWARSRAARYLAENQSDIRVPVYQQHASKIGNSFARHAQNALRLRRLDAPIGDEDGATFGDMTADPNAGPDARVEDALVEAGHAELLEKLFSTLTDQERTIIQRRLRTDETETLKEVGDSYGLSRERIRQVQERALEKLRYALEDAGVKTLDDLDELDPDDLTPTDTAIERRPQPVLPVEQLPLPVPAATALPDDLAEACLCILREAGVALPLKEIVARLGARGCKAHYDQIVVALRMRCHRQLTQPRHGWYALAAVGAQSPQAVRSTAPSSPTPPMACIAVLREAGKPLHANDVCQRLRARGHQVDGHAVVQSLQMLASLPSIGSEAVAQPQPGVFQLVSAPRPAAVTPSTPLRPPATAPPSR